MVPPGVDTVTPTAPAAWAGVTNVSVLPLAATVAVAVWPPMVTVVAPVTKPVPVIVTTVPPAIGPWVGDNDAAVGTTAGGTYWKWRAGLDVPPGVVTVTSTDPAAWAGVTNDRLVAEPTVAVAVWPPMLTVVAPDTKPVPVIVTAVLPAVGPLTGDNDRAVGTTAGGTYWKWRAGLDVPPGVVTVTSTDPAAWAGVTNDRLVAEPTVATTDTPSTVTDVPPTTNPEPDTDTAVPPATGPLTGDNEAAVGTARNSNTNGPDVPPCVVTVTSTDTGRMSRRHERQARRRAPPAATDTPSTVTDVPPPTNPEPDTDTTIPPATGPLTGANDTAVGTGRYLNVNG